jgi:hypothetical protein
MQISQGQVKACQSARTGVGFIPLTTRKNKCATQVLRVCMAFEQQDFQASRTFTQHQNCGGIARRGVNNVGCDLHEGLN